MREANLALPIFIVCFSLTIPASLVQRIQSGLQQGFHASMWQGLGSLLALCGILATAYFDGGLHWLVLALFGGPLVAAALNSVIFFGKLRPDLCPSRSEFSFAAGVEIAKLSSSFFVLQLGVGAFYGTDSIMIAQLLGPDSVGAYAVPERMFSIVSTLLAMALMPLWPAYAEASARGDHGWVRRTFVRSMAISTVGALAMSTILVLSGNVLLKIWVGKTFDPSLPLLVGFSVWENDRSRRKYNVDLFKWLPYYTLSGGNNGDHRHFGNRPEIIFDSVLRYCRSCLVDDIAVCCFYAHTLLYFHLQMAVLA